MVYLSQSAQLTGGNVALELAWDGKYNLNHLLSHENR